MIVLVSYFSHKINIIMGTKFTKLPNIFTSFQQNIVTLQSRADRTMQKTFNNIEFYATDNFHSWSAPPPTQKTGYV